MSKHTTRPVMKHRFECDFRDFPADVVADVVNAYRMGTTLAFEVTYEDNTDVRVYEPFLDFEWIITGENFHSDLVNMLWELPNVVNVSYREGGELDQCDWVLEWEVKS